MDKDIVRVLRFIIYKKWLTIYIKEKERSSSKGVLDDEVIDYLDCKGLSGRVVDLYEKVNIEYKGNTYTIMVGDRINGLDVISIMLYKWDRCNSSKVCICRARDGELVGPYKVQELLIKGYNIDIMDQKIINSKNKYRYK